MRADGFGLRVGNSIHLQHAQTRYDKSTSACDLVCEYQHNANVTCCDIASPPTTTTTSPDDATDTTNTTIDDRRQRTSPMPISSHVRHERPRARTTVHERPSSLSADSQSNTTLDEHPLHLLPPRVSSSAHQ